MSPSKIDVEIRCLSPKNGGSEFLMEYFLKALYETLTKKTDFELIHSYLALFLQIHFEIAVNYPAVMEVLEELSKDKSWDRIQEMINYYLCASNYIRGAVI
ncbi:WD repeat-containing protein 36 [Caerostris extrusa]|uniref:WD repeat-containing protein 36 n=1 Tax=Caerostris extrusa TaxID=172846 RepID=A0AAV4R2J9_CAEEX|nr:WD repeat-containing protein 36 [Caerostris extrusa]